MRLLFFIGILFLPSLFFALPSKGQLIYGKADINKNGNFLIINQHTDKAITNWKDFSIKLKETVQIVQPSSLSSSLNRVVGNKISSIYGNLISNGKVYLINQNGILIGPHGKINTNGFIASTLDIDDSRFVKEQELEFFSKNCSSIKNYGVIDGLDKDVILIASEVINEGSIKAQNGKASLIGAAEVVLFEKGKDNIKVRDKSTGSISNKGFIESVEAELIASSGNMYSLAINQEGIIKCKGIANKNGRVILTADIGDINVDGEIKAQNSDCSGGEVHILADAITLNENAEIDVSGEKGGGTLLVGGDYKGSNPEIKNAKRLFVDKNAYINANAILEGDGGKVILWADETNEFFGKVTAKGGKIFGNGGFVEISAHNNLIFKGIVCTTGENGKDGNLLLDPCNITISNGASNPAYTTDPNYPDYIPSPPPAVLNVTELIAALVGNDVIISTSGAGGDAGNITVTNGIPAGQWTSDHSLTLNANNNITVNDDIIFSGSTTLSLHAGRSIDISSGVNISSTNSGGVFDAIHFETTGAVAGIYTAISVGSSSIQSVSGNIYINGVGASAATAVNEKYGVDFDQSTITSFGIGNIELIGSGPQDTTGGSNNHEGLHCNNATIESNDGDISITGTGGTGNNQGMLGVELEYSSIKTTGIGSIEIDGTGGAAVGSPTGSGYNYGIRCYRSSIETTGNGTITLNGAGGMIGTTSDFNYGINFVGSSTNHMEITSVSGDIIITGTGQADGDSNRGMRSEYLYVTSTDGDITLTGTGTGGASVGIHLSMYTSVDSTNGDITLEGIAPVGISSFAFSSNNVYIGSATAGGTISIIGDLMNLSVSSIRGTGTFNVKTYTEPRNIDFGVGATGSGLIITDTYLAKILNGFNIIEIGSTSNTGTVTCHGYTFSDSLTVEGGTIIVSGALVDSGNEVNLTANDTITITIGSAITAASGTFLIGQSAPGTFNLNSTGSSNIFSVLGGANDDSFNINVSGQTIYLDGQGGTNTLTGHDVANDWILSSANGGSLGSVTFDNMHILVGGTDIDTFVISEGTTFNGTIDGNANTNVLNYSSYTSDISVDLDAGTATGISGVGVTNIQKIIASQAKNTLSGETGVNNIFEFQTNPTVASSASGLTGSNTLIKTTEANTWNITAANNGNVGNITFTDIDNLVGGSGVDTFKITEGITFLGTIDGDANTNVLDYQSYTINDISVDLNANTATGISGAGVNNIQKIIASQTINTLLGENGADNIFEFPEDPADTSTVNGRTNVSGNTLIFSSSSDKTWNITSDYSGDVEHITSFSNIQILEGGAATDIFVFDGAWNLTSLDGIGGSNNKIIGPNAINNGWIVNGLNTGTVEPSGVASPIDFSNIQYLTGGDGAAKDSFYINAGGRLNGQIDGKGGNENLLDYTGFGAPVTVNLSTTPGTATNIDGGVIGLQDLTGYGSLIGGNFNDTFTVISDGISFIDGIGGTNKLIGPNENKTWHMIDVAPDVQDCGWIGPVGSGIEFHNIQNLEGGSYNDIFSMEGAPITGNIDGGDGKNYIDYSSYLPAPAVTVNLQTSSATDVTGTISNMANVIGGLGVNTLIGKNDENNEFIFTSPPTGNSSVNGGSSSVNTLEVRSGNNSFNITATNAGDVGNITFSNIQYLQAGTGQDTFTLFPNGQIEKITGRSSSDVIIGKSDGDNSWNILGNDTGNVRGVSLFENMENITGGAEKDTFNLFFDSAGITGTIDGGSLKTNTLIYWDFTIPVFVDLVGGTATNIGHIVNIFDYHILNIPIQAYVRGEFTNVNLSFYENNLFLDRFDYMLENYKRFYLMLEKVLKKEDFINKKRKPEQKSM